MTGGILHPLDSSLLPLISYHGNPRKFPRRLLPLIRLLDTGNPRKFPAPFIAAYLPLRHRKTPPGVLSIHRKGWNPFKGILDGAQGFFPLPSVFPLFLPVSCFFFALSLTLNFALPFALPLPSLVFSYSLPDPQLCSSFCPPIAPPKKKLWGLSYMVSANFRSVKRESARDPKRKPM